MVVFSWYRCKTQTNAGLLELEWRANSKLLEINVGLCAKIFILYVWKDCSMSAWCCVARLRPLSLAEQNHSAVFHFGLFTAVMCKQPLLPRSAFLFYFYIKTLNMEVTRLSSTLSSSGVSPPPYPSFLYLAFCFCLHVFVSLATPPPPHFFAPSDCIYLFVLCFIRGKQWI